MKDAATGSWFNRKRLEPGESFTISVDPKDIEEVISLKQIRTAVVVDEAGYEYMVDESEFEKVIESYLE